MTNGTLDRGNSAHAESQTSQSAEVKIRQSRTYIDIAIDDAKKLFRVKPENRDEKFACTLFATYTILTPLAEENLQEWMQSQYDQQDFDAINQVVASIITSAQKIQRVFPHIPRNQVIAQAQSMRDSYKHHAADLVANEREYIIPAPSYVPEEGVDAESISPEDSKHNLNAGLFPAAPKVDLPRVGNHPTALDTDDITRQHIVVTQGVIPQPTAPVAVRPPQAPTPVEPQFKLEDLAYIESVKGFEGQQLTLKNKEHLEGPIGIKAIYEREYTIQLRIATYYKYILFAESQAKGRSIRDLLVQNALSDRSLQALVFFLDTKDRFKLPVLDSVLKKNRLGFGTTLVERGLGLDKKVRRQKLARIREYNQGTFMRVMAVATDAEIKQLTELSITPQENQQAMNGMRIRLMKRIDDRYNAPTAYASRYTLRDRSLKDSQKLIFKPTRKPKHVEQLVNKIYGIQARNNEQVLSKERLGFRVAYIANLDAVAHRASMYLFGQPIPSPAQMPTLVALVDLLDTTIASMDNVPSTLVVLREAIAGILTRAEFKNAQGQRVPQAQSKYFEEYEELPTAGEVIGSGARRLRMCIAMITVRPIQWIISRPSVLREKAERARAAAEAAKKAQGF